MNRRLSLLLALIILLTLCTSASSTNTQAAPAFNAAAFKSLWEYSDKAVEEIPGLGRGYTWGPNTFGQFDEPYADAPGGKRQVHYFDKSRMELGADGTSVTNGLLTKELVTGLQQDGNSIFTQRNPAAIGVGGDPDSNPKVPTYASFQNVVTFEPGQNRAADRTSQTIGEAIDRNGQVTKLASPPAALTFARYESLLGHNVPGVFLDFQNLAGRVWNGSSFVQGAVYTTNPTANVFGYAITEPYWSRATISGVERDVLIQLYERRILTYTPTNPAGFQVEMGNIGQHYYSWRYGNGNGSQPTPPVQPPMTTMPVTTVEPTTTAPATTIAPTTVPATTPPATTTLPTAPATGCFPASSGTGAFACVSDSNPSKNSTVTVYGRLVVNGKPVAGQVMNTTWNYKTTTSYCSGTTDNNGVASCARDIGRATSGYTVVINISIGSYSTSTSFTPK